MALGNSPTQHTLLRLEARKSFSLGVVLYDPDGRPVDLTDCQLRLVAAGPEGANLFAGDDEAIVDEPTDGYARFEVQASTLDHPAGEYPYVLVLVASGYSSVLVKGTVVIEDNPEHDSVGETFDTVQPAQQLTAVLAGRNVIKVFVGGQLPPGYHYVRTATAEAIETFDPDSVAMLPKGGAPGYVMTKTGGGDYEAAWLPVGNGAFALDATGQPAGHAPVAQGDGTWDWAETGINVGPADAVPVSNGSTLDWVDRSEVAPAPSWHDIQDAPSLDFIPNTTLVTEMPGVHFVTTVPVSGIDGHLYFVIES